MGLPFLFWAEAASLYADHIRNRISRKRPNRIPDDLCATGKPRHGHTINHLGCKLFYLHPETIFKLSPQY